MNFKLLLVLVVATNCLLQCSNKQKSDTSNISEPITETETKTYLSDSSITNKSNVVNQNDRIMNEVVVLSNDFYADLKNQDYNGANENLHPEAIKITPPIEWTKIYKNAEVKKGKLGYVTMYDHAVKTKLNSVNGMGDYAELIFDAQYKDGNMREKLTYFRKDSSEPFKMLAYEYNEIVDKIFISDIFR